MLKSWKTTVAALLGIIAVAATQGQAMLDGDPATNPNWGLVLPLIAAFAGLIFSRDNNVTSEEAGAKKPEGK